jgi:hypothetical protein
VELPRGSSSGAGSRAVAAAVKALQLPRRGSTSGRRNRSHELARRVAVWTLDEPPDGNELAGPL